MRTKLVTTLKRRPAGITQHGKPAAYVVDVASYDEPKRRLSVVEGIAPGEQAIREGRLRTQKEAKRRLSKRLKQHGHCRRERLKFV
jgi:PHD/YefM family antitoxin component YafN of YafNO toxin-antitoxin module